ncbi:hypothetical protein [Mammaliicoccus sciuri]|uniref:hypothetical protein n=1 Tax=Mammaliicoccus sciuri TaxID=1296 RepID=UPI003F54839C
MQNTLKELVDNINVNQWFEKEYNEAQKHAQETDYPFLYEEEYNSIKNYISLEIVGQNYNSNEVNGKKFFKYIEICNDLITNKINMNFKNSETLILDSIEFWYFIVFYIKKYLSENALNNLSNKVDTSDFVQIIINNDKVKSKIYFHEKYRYDYTELDIDTVYAKKIKEINEKAESVERTNRIVNINKERMKAIFFYTRENDFNEENEEHQFICVLLDRIYHFIIQNKLNIDVETFSYILNKLLINMDKNYSTIYTKDIKDINLDQQLKLKLNITTFLNDKEISKIGENEISMIDCLVSACIFYLNGYEKEVKKNG